MRHTGSAVNVPLNPNAGGVLDTKRAGVHSENPDLRVLGHLRERHTHARAHAHTHTHTHTHTERERERERDTITKKQHIPAAVTQVWFVDALEKLAQFVLSCFLDLEESNHAVFFSSD